MHLRNSMELMKVNTERETVLQIEILFGNQKITFNFCNVLTQ